LLLWIVRSFFPDRPPIFLSQLTPPDRSPPHFFFPHSLLSLRIRDVFVVDPCLSPMRFFTLCLRETSRAYKLVNFRESLPFSRLPAPSPSPPPNVLFYGSVGRQVRLCSWITLDTPLCAAATLSTPSFSSPLAIKRLLNLKLLFRWERSPSFFGRSSDSAPSPHEKNAGILDSLFIFPFFSCLPPVLSLFPPSQRARRIRSL